MFKLEMKTGGASFRNEMTGEADDFSEAIEVARILNEVRAKIRNGCRSAAIMDINGNRIGSWSLE